MPKIKNAFKLTAVLSALFLIVSCTKKQEECEGAETFGDKCVEVVGSVDPSLLTMNFKDSFYYDENQADWVRTSAEDVNSALLPNEISLYSAPVNSSVTEAMNSVKLAESQVATPSSPSRNQIFYIKMEAKEGVTTLCSYDKIKDGVNVAKLSCSFERDGDHVYLPLINDKFGDKLYASGDRLGDRFLNEITIVKQYGKTKSAEKKIKFYTTIANSNANYTIGLSETMTNFSLDRRWNYYMNSAKNGPNLDFDIFKLTDKQASVSASNIDLRVLFKDTPRITIEQEVFYEIPIDLFAFDSSKTVYPSRGYDFRTHKITTNSSTDFRYKISVGDQSLTQTALEWKRESFPGGQALDVRFIADLTQNVAYSNPNATPLLTPLAPSCFLEKGKLYEPWVHETPRNNDIAAGKFHAICQIESKDKLVINDPTSPSVTQALVDTWYNAFDFIPDRPSIRGIGSSYGIRSVSFRVAACLRIQTRSDNDNSESGWTDISQGNSNCGDEAGSSNWVYVNFEKRYSITDDLSIYSGTPALKALLERLKVSAGTPDPVMKFNGERLNGTSVRHLY